MSKFFQEARTDASTTIRLNQEVGELLPSGVESIAVSTGVAEMRFRDATKVCFNKSPHLLNQIGSKDVFVTESYRALRTRLLRHQFSSGFRSVVLTSTMQGEGKTLSALNLGICTAQLPDTKVLLVDADLRTGGMTKYLKSAPAKGLMGLLSGRVEFQEAVHATDIPNLFIVPAGTGGTPTPELFSGARWKEFLGWCSESFKLVLVDSPPILGLSDFEVMSAACDRVLMVVRALATSRELLKKAAGQLDQKKVIGTIYNATDENPTRKYSQYYSANGSKH